jgi:late competence protein required for DNA uptake (superfamily II DNA/RNA helicase)
MTNKSVEQSQRIGQINRNNRVFINDSVYNNQDKLLCVQCNKHSKQNYIHKYSNQIKCKECTKQIELPI